MICSYIGINTFIQSMTKQLKYASAFVNPPPPPTIEEQSISAESLCCMLMYYIAK